jgi:starch phosphorylase
LLAVLKNKEKPVQLVIAGKAHPQDSPGQEMIQRWIEFIRRGPARSQVVFLSDYDMRMAEHLVQGVDLWLNTPRRPWEACGTSGMKVLVNGGLNLSELDGWWAEAYSQDVGWALGDGLEHGDDPAWDAKEAEQLYTLLEQEVIPEFYKRDNSGIPAGWIARVRESMARLTPTFSATRCVLEYTEKYYLPLAAAYLRRANDSGKCAEIRLRAHREHRRTTSLRYSGLFGRNGSWRDPGRTLRQRGQWRRAYSAGHASRRIVGRPECLALFRVGSRDSSCKGFHAQDRPFSPRCIYPVGGA